MTSVGQRNEPHINKWLFLKTYRSPSETENCNNSTSLWAGPAAEWRGARAVAMAFKACTHLPPITGNQGSQREAGKMQAAVPGLQHTHPDKAEGGSAPGLFDLALHK